MDVNTLLFSCSEHVPFVCRAMMFLVLKGLIEKLPLAQYIFGE